MQKLLPSFGLLLALGTGLAAFSSDSPSPAPVKTRSGLVTGAQNATGDVAFYKGIPFAAPPVGALRWRAPQPVQPWTAARACVQDAPSPMQATPAPFSMWSTEFLIPKAPISEDCLYLNVWTATSAPRSRRPVLVWVYGGGFMSGGSAVPIYDGEALARQGLVVVSFNYRVGPFGFLAHPELTKESGRQAAGNYGLMDQVAALRWVHDNIAAFGGDPANVTIAGQSAGAQSVSCLVASPLAKELFQKAIAESGAGFAHPYPTLPQAEAEGIRYAEALKAPSLAELRRLPAAALVQQSPTQRGPIIDGYVLPDAITRLFSSGRSNPVALLTGWNEDDGLLFSPPQAAPEFRRQAAQQYGAQANTFLQYYPAGTDAEAAASQWYLSRDQLFGLPNYTWANVQSQQLHRPAYVYRFARKVPATGEYVKYGAFHTGEVPYIFNNLRLVDRPWEPGDQQLARTMSAYWVNFARTGNPNGPGLPNWPTYQADKQTMVLDLKPAAKPLPNQAALDFLITQKPVK